VRWTESCIPYIYYLTCEMDTGMPKVGEIIELSAMGNPHAQTMRFEIISVDPRTNLIEARACKANADGEYSHIRMKLGRLQ
jgi:hypothetical protein